MRATVERLGAAASLACAVHCAALPILIGAGAGGAVSWLNHRPVEWGLVLLSATVGTVSAWRGFKSHGNRAVAATLVIAAVALVALTAQHSFAVGTPTDHDHGLGALSAVCGVALGGSLFVNRRLCRKCSTCVH
jgi:hypothetical protein